MLTTLNVKLEATVKSNVMPGPTTSEEPEMAKRAPTVGMEYVNVSPGFASTVDSVATTRPGVLVSGMISVAGDKLMPVGATLGDFTKPDANTTVLVSVAVTATARMDTC